MSGFPAEVGSTANNYAILARLAVGGMAEIFLARGTSTTGVERYCVLKRVLRERANDVHFVRMFLQEARLAAQLQHPNIAQVYDIGKLGESYFFTMEYVHGETVRALLQRARSLRRELPIATVMTVIAGAAAGLHHAHERIGPDRRPLGIVHRDVSPSNLMVSFEGAVKVVDFGVAKMTDVGETRSGTVKGKISYLSPEQCRGTALDRRSDLFALGIVMWEMLTTDRLFKRGSDFENMNAIVNDPVPLPSQLRPNVPRELDAICLRLLEKHPDRRFQTGDELIEALEAAAPHIGAMPSPSGLGRFMRELFGQRPEPWHELATADAPEGVTVTSEPLPSSEIIAAVDDSLDDKLRRVPTLAHDIPESSSLEGYGSQPPMPSPYPVVQRPLVEAPRRARWIMVLVIVLAAIVGTVAAVLVVGSGGPAPVAVIADAAPAEVNERITIVASPADASVAVEVDASVEVVVDGGEAPLVEEPEPSPMYVAMQDGRFDEVLAMCAKGMTRETAATCVMAACHLKQEARARNWLPRVSSKLKRATLTVCKAVGIDLTPKAAPPPPRSDNCEKNPMACQR